MSLKLSETMKLKAQAGIQFVLSRSLTQKTFGNYTERKSADDGD